MRARARLTHGEEDLEIKCGKVKTKSEKKLSIKIYSSTKTDNRSARLQMCTPLSLSLKVNPILFKFKLSLLLLLFLHAFGCTLDLWGCHPAADHLNGAGVQLLLMLHCI